MEKKKISELPLTSDVTNKYTIVSDASTNKSERIYLPTAVSAEVLPRLQGSATDSSANTDPFIFLGDFGTLAAALAYLDGGVTGTDVDGKTLAAIDYTQPKWAGNWRFRVNGVFYQGCNYVGNYANRVYIQTIEGALRLDGTGGLASTGGTVYGQFWRAQEGGAWTSWSEVVGGWVKTQIESNAANIALNLDEIQKNAEAIAANTTAIATNTSKLSSQGTALAAAQQEIAAAQDDISALERFKTSAETQIYQLVQSLIVLDTRTRETDAVVDALLGESGYGLKETYTDGTAVLTKADNAAFAAASWANLRNGEAYDGLATFKVTAAHAVTSLSHVLTDRPELRSADLGLLDCSGLTSAPYAFSGCSAMESVTLPAELPLLSDAGAIFYGCTALKSVTLPALPAVKTLVSAFNGCTALKSVTLPALPAVTMIRSAFQGCTALKSVELPASMPLLDDLRWAFQNCAALATLAMPDDMSAATQYTGAFTGCTALSTIRCSAETEQWLRDTAADTLLAVDNITFERRA